MEDRKPRILIIENSIAVTGALKSITQSAYDLKNYFNFQFLIPKNSKGRTWIEEKDFYTIYDLPMKEISRRFSSMLLYFPYLFINAIRLNRILKRNSISLIHLNDLYNLLPVANRLLGNNTPYICHIRFLPDRFPKILLIFWLKLHYRFASKVVAVSQSVINQLPTHEKLVLINNELPVYEKYPDVVVPKVNRSWFTFLYLSNFMKGKGQDFALEAFAKIHLQLPNWKLRFVGGDMGLKKNSDYRERLKQKARTLGIFEKTEWIGFTNEVELEYKQADIVLNFSESESFSITCVEALYFGKPLIATECGGPSEIIEKDKTGLLVANRDVEAMSNAMKLVACDNILQINLGLIGRKKIREKFASKNGSLLLKELYYQVMLNN